MYNFFCTSFNPSTPVFYNAIILSYLITQNMRLNNEKNFVLKYWQGTLKDMFVYK